jgi:hypothetical protein
VRHSSGVKAAGCTVAGFGTRPSQSTAFMSISSTSYPLKVAFPSSGRSKATSGRLQSLHTVTCAMVASAVAFWTEKTVFVTPLCPHRSTSTSK